MAAPELVSTGSLDTLFGSLDQRRCWSRSTPPFVSCGSHVGFRFSTGAPVRVSLLALVPLEVPGRAAPDLLQAHGREAEAHCAKVDKYRRAICRVIVDGADVGLEQIRRGLAWHFAKYAHEQRPEDRRAYADAEREARADRGGLWRDRQPVAPWEWRATHAKQ